MNSISQFLPKLFRWVFTALVALPALGALAVVVFMLIDPRIPAGAHFGPYTLNIAGSVETVVLRAADGHSAFTLTALKGGLILFVANVEGFFEVLKHYGLPVMLLRLVFLAGLFEILRRLFRNVGRGDSFSVQSVRLVQGLAGWLLLYSIVSTSAENWLAQAVYTYLAGHAVVTLSGTPLHLPAPHGEGFPRAREYLFGGSLFFTGLLVLALSEVFRQGLALKAENDLTV